MFSLGPGNVQVLYVPGDVPGTCGPADNNCAVLEANLDLEWAGAVAKNALLIYVAAANAYCAVEYAIDQNLAPVISLSFASGELSSDTPASHAYYQTLAQQANSQGITWVASSGDAGAAWNEDDGNSSELVATHGLGVDFPASIPEVTSVGGSEFAEDNSSYWDNNGVALGYIPEQAWNDTGKTGVSGIWAGGGGVSILFQKPSWQSGSGVMDPFFRNVPDLAMAASAVHDGYIYCSQRSCANGVIALPGEGGTSASAPVFAGIVALINQYLVSQGALAQPGLGNINPVLYQLAANFTCDTLNASGTNCAFHDITSGNNIVPCDPSLPLCNNGFFGYSAGTGYDRVTGLGSVDAFKLAQAWSSSSPNVPVTVNGNMLSESVDTSGSCLVPSPTASFLSTDQAAWLWFDISAANVGDVASATWFTPGGALYATSRWDPISWSGATCFWANLYVANYAPASLPGEWTVHAALNGSSLFTLNFNVEPPVTVTAKAMAETVNTGQCTAPAPATSFPTTDPSAYVWFSVSGGNAGDVASVTWYSPSGSAYQTGNWAPLANSDTSCFWSAMGIANNPPASLSGNWNVRVSWNGVPLFTQSFTISAPGTSPRLQITSLSPSAAVAGGSSQTLAILGNGFVPSSTVTLNGQARATTGVPDGRQLAILLTPADMASVGTHLVVVTNPASGGAPSISNGFGFQVLDPGAPQPTVTAVSIPQRMYAAGDWFTAAYSTLAGTAPGTFDLMISITALATGNTYYYYDDPSDANEWLHTTPRALRTGTPTTGQFILPTFQVADSVPSGDYHVSAYFSTPGANQGIGTAAQADFTVATDTPAGACFVATAAFGSPMAGQVRNLRAFRDRVLLSMKLGKAFVRWYYSWSPRAAAWIRGRPAARKVTRVALWVPVAFAWVSLRTNAAVALVLFLAGFVLLAWSIRKGPRWWRGLCVAVIAIAILAA